MRLHIEILEQESGQMRDVDFEANDGVVTLGRDRGNRVVLGAPSVSRHHCKILPAGEGWTILDEGSTLGTIVNGVKLEPSVPRPIVHGDVVTCASYELRIHIVPMTDPTLQPDPHALDRLLREAGESAVAPARVWLFAGGEPKSHDLPAEGTSLTIGRSSECDIQIADPFKVTSAVHAKIERNWAGVFLYDASINGVYVDGQRVREEAKLQDGSRITIAVGEEDPDRPLLVFTTEGNAETPPAHGLGVPRAGAIDGGGQGMGGSPGVSPSRAVSGGSAVAGAPGASTGASSAQDPASAAVPSSDRGASSAAGASPVDAAPPGGAPAGESVSHGGSSASDRPDDNAGAGYGSQGHDPADLSDVSDSLYASAARGSKSNLLPILVLIVSALALATVLVWGVLLLRG